MVYRIEKGFINLPYTFWTKNIVLGNNFAWVIIWKFGDQLWNDLEFNSTIKNSSHEIINIKIRTYTEGNSVPVLGFSKTTRTLPILRTTIYTQI